MKCGFCFTKSVVSVCETGAGGSHFAGNVMSYVRKMAKISCGSFFARGKISHSVLLDSA